VDVTPEFVLSQIPGWENASVRELSGGLTNETWLVVQADRKAVLKIDKQPRGAPYNSRPVEASIQSMAASRGLANAVFHADSQILLTEYVEGDVWNAEFLAQANNIERIAESVRRLHALPLTGRAFDSLVAARRYAALIEGSDKTLVARCMRSIETKRLPHNLCCCHNDLVAANIIATPHVKFLDWEYACDNDPFFDLATIIEHHALGEELALRLLNAYFDGDGERWLPQLRQQQELYVALCWLWLAARPGSHREELDSVARRIER
jgi:thiamine kinase-like enzyme